MNLLKETLDYGKFEKLKIKDLEAIAKAQARILEDFISGEDEIQEILSLRGWIRFLIESMIRIESRYEDYSPSLVNKQIGESP